MKLYLSLSQAVHLPLFVSLSISRSRSVSHTHFYTTFPTIFVYDTKKKKNKQQFRNQSKTKKTKEKFYFSGLIFVPLDGLLCVLFFSFSFSNRRQQRPPSPIDPAVDLVVGLAPAAPFRDAPVGGSEKRVSSALHPRRRKRSQLSRWHAPRPWLQSGSYAK